MSFEPTASRTPSISTSISPASWAPSASPEISGSQSPIASTGSESPKESTEPSKSGSASPLTASPSSTLSPSQTASVSSSPLSEPSLAVTQTPTPSSNTPGITATGSPSPKRSTGPRRSSSPLASATVSGPMGTASESPVILSTSSVSPSMSTSPQPVASALTSLSPSRSPIVVVGPTQQPTTKATPSTSVGGSSSSLPGGVGGISGIAIGSLIVVAIISAVLYKTCAVFPGLSGFTISSIFSSSDDSNGRGGGGGRESETLMEESDSPWDQPWRNPSELPQNAIEEGQEAAALLGGEFAGLLKPGAAKVRPPQVITRLVVPGLCMALSQLTPDSAASDAASMTSGVSSDGTSFRSARFPAMGEAEDEEQHGSTSVAGFAASGPKIDLLFVFDTSGSLSWREYREMKELLTKPGGLISEVMSRMSFGSRIGFIEYAYDAVVVSELDKDQDAVRRRILSSFQGDANNWDKDGMYIYETGDDVGGNVLRKVNSLRQQQEENENAEMNDEIEEQEQPSVQAEEVPPAMNGMCREAHLALKWSRFEMLPPVANREIQAKLLNANRIRRVVVVNAGELTSGGTAEGGLEAAIAEKEDMEELGIRIITLGVGENCERNLSKVASGRSYFYAPSVDAIAPMMGKIVKAIVKLDPKRDGRIAVNPPEILKRRRQRKREKSTMRKQHAVYRAVKAGTMDPAKSISKGLPRRACDLPPWFTEPPEQTELDGVGNRGMVELTARNRRVFYDSDD